MSIEKKDVLVTIITVTFNAEEFLESTIQSVISQKYNSTEYIIIDGGSTDGTVEIIKKYQDHIKYWVSEPDKGISDAWNKGIKLATGDIIGILNAGDYFSDETYIDIVANGLQIDKKMFCYGDTIMVDEFGQIVTHIYGKFNPLKLYVGLGFGFYHPGCFATRPVYKEVGEFVLRYKLAMDSDWLFRCYRADVVFKKLDLSCFMLDGGVSRKSGLSAYGEYLQAMSENNFSLGYVYLSMIIAGIRGLLKSLFFKRN
jgi:glycosyltransferase involved in cell wall biosynthesis